MPRLFRYLCLAACVAGGPWAVAAFAQAYPERPIKLVVPYTPGGQFDILARMVGERMGPILGRLVVVENKPGAGTMLGAEFVARSKNDGYTLLYSGANMFAIAPHVYAKVPYQRSDFQTISLVSDLPMGLVVNAAMVPAKTLQEFIAWAKQRGKISFGSPGIGTTPHLSATMFAKRAGLDAVHVPFRGASQTIPAMLSGDVTYALDNLASYVSTIDSGKMRPLAVTSAQRWPTMPEIPTMAEAGLPDFVVTSWAAFVVPTGTPRPIIDKLAGAMQQVAADPEIQRRFLVAGARCIASTPEQAAALGAKERPMWQEMVRLSGARAE